MPCCVFVVIGLTMIDTGPEYCGKGSTGKFRPQEKIAGAGRGNGLRGRRSSEERFIQATMLKGSLDRIGYERVLTVLRG